MPVNGSQPLNGFSGNGSAIGYNGVRRCAETGARRASGQRLDQAAHDLMCRRRIGLHNGQDLFDRNVFLLFVPAVVVRAESQRGETHLCFASQFGFLQVRHPDDGCTPGAVEERLGTRREGGPFHADVGASLMDGGPRLLRRREKHAGEYRRNRIAEGHVAHDAPTEKGRRPAFRAIDELIDDDDMPPLLPGQFDPALQRTARLASLDPNDGIDI